MPCSRSDHVRVTAPSPLLLLVRSVVEIPTVSRSSQGVTCSCRPSPVSPDTRRRSCKCRLGGGLRGGAWTDPGHPVAARENFKARGRSAHLWGNTGAPVLFQEQRPLEDPIALALSLWNTMVSGWGSPEAAAPAWGVGPQEGRGLHHTPTLPTAWMEGQQDARRIPER